MTRKSERHRRFDAKAKMLCQVLPHSFPAEYVAIGYIEDLPRGFLAGSRPSARPSQKPGIGELSQLPVCLVSAWEAERDSQFPGDFSKDTNDKRYVHRIAEDIANDNIRAECDIVPACVLHSLLYFS